VNWEAGKYRSEGDEFTKSIKPEEGEGLPTKGRKNMGGGTDRRGVVTQNHEIFGGSQRHVLGFRAGCL